MTQALIQWLEDNSFASLAELLSMGGPVMLVLALLAFAALAAGLYALFISILSSPRQSKQLKESLTLWKQGDRQAAQQPLENHRRPLERLLGFTLAERTLGADGPKLREEVARRAQSLFVPFESPLKLLEVTAALAPLLGLLGTVMGMMAAFSALASAQGAADPNQLSGGIYEALVTTAAGLVIAIPAAAAAAWLEFRLRRQQQQVNDLLSQALNLEPQPRVHLHAHVAETKSSPGVAPQADPAQVGTTRQTRPVAQTSQKFYEGSHATG